MPSVFRVAPQAANPSIERTVSGKPETVRSCRTLAAMIRRWFATAAVALGPCLAAGQSPSMSTSLASIGAGPFEFPISGQFVIERESSGSTTFTTADQSRRYIVGFFRNISAPVSASKIEQIDRLEKITRGNWERFASEERGVVVRAFRRSTGASGVVVFSMATEFVVDGQRQYYVQFATTDGPRFGVIFAEGEGTALKVLQQLEPLIMRVKVADGG